MPHRHTNPLGGVTAPQHPGERLVCADGRRMEGPRAIHPPLRPNEWRPGAGVEVPSTGNVAGREGRRREVVVPVRAPEKRDGGGLSARVKGLGWASRGGVGGIVGRRIMVTRKVLRAYL